MADPLTELLAAYEPRTGAETADVDRVRRLAATAPDPWARSEPLHVTASAVIVHPPSARVLLRWHARTQAWLQVGGHGDPGENVPLDVATREAVEETGLDDVAPWPDARLLHVVVVDVPASSREPAHQHADLRFVLATAKPDAARGEDDVAAVRWLPLGEARATTTSPSLQVTLDRLAHLLPS